MVTIRPALREAMERHDHAAWLGEVDELVAYVADEWSLRLGEPFDPGGECSWTAPALTAAGEEVVLKVELPHPEALDEAKGLRLWDGAGAVRVYEDLQLENGYVLLLERCLPGTELRSRPEPGQDEVITGLLERLWRADFAGAGFRPLSEMCDMWADEYEDRPPSERATLDRGLAREGIGLLRSLPRQGGREVLLCTDLHAGNVLSAEREPWLVIDPKPYFGDPHYDLTQHMFNCEERLRAAPLALAERLAGLLGLDAERIILWGFARAVAASPYWPGMAELAAELALS